MQARARCTRVAVGGVLVGTLICAAPQLTSPQGSFPNLGSPILAAQTLVLKGTNIGGVPTDAEYLGFVGSVISGVMPDETPVTPGPGNLVDYPASFWPVSKGGFADPKWNDSVNTGKNNVASAVSMGDDDALIFGYSQGAVVASQFKASAPTPEHDITYVLLANPNRPNGGFLERFAGITIPILDVTGSGATPDTGGTTYDIALQYDGWSDFPRHFTHILSTINALAGTIFLHGFANQAAQIDLDSLVDPTKTDIVTDGATTYYTVATPRLPILIALQTFVPSPLLTALDAPLRVMVEWGYDRSIGPGTPETVSLWDIDNPLRDMVNLLKAIPTGIDDGLAEATGDPDYRPFGTTQAGMYGVGGRDISLPPALSAVSVEQQAIRPQTRARAVVAPRPTSKASQRHSDAANAQAARRHTGSSRAVGGSGR